MSWGWNSGGWWSEAETDGTANLLGLDLPAAEANAAMRRINRLARATKTKGDPTSIDQIRADVFLDLLVGRHQDAKGGDRGIVDLRVDLTTLAGLDDNPGVIPGWGPVIADIAREVAGEQHDSEWRIIITDDDGRPIGVTTTAHYHSETSGGSEESHLRLPWMPDTGRSV